MSDPGPWLSLDPPPRSGLEPGGTCRGKTVDRSAAYVGKHRIDPNDPPEPKGFGADPYGRTKEDWERHAE